MNNDEKRKIIKSGLMITIKKNDQSTIDNFIDSIIEMCDNYENQIIKLQDKLYDYEELLEIDIND